MANLSHKVFQAMRQFPLLGSLPQPRRDVMTRANTKTPEIIEEAKLFGPKYFDGPREYGYGGYKYDGRWLPVAHDIIGYFDLRPGQRVLDIGCAKGFLVRDLMATLPGLQVFGLDISHYAVVNCHPEVVGYIHQGSIVSVPFPDASFDVVLCINTIHNLTRPMAKLALQEIMRIQKPTGDSFVQVDSYHTPEQKALFEQWVLTAEFHGYPKDWLAVFKESGYEGHYDFTVI